MGNLVLKGLGGKIARFFVWFASSRRGPVPELEDLPLVIYSLRAEHPAPRLFAVFFSGDGGWANLASHVASALQAAGIPVAGVDCMRYFWGGKTAGQTSQSLERIIVHFSKEWGCSQVVLIG